MEGYSRVNSDGEYAGEVNEVMVEDVVRSAQRASMNREERRLPVSSQLMFIMFPPTLDRRQ
jgi:hypothetical protein